MKHSSKQDWIEGHKFEFECFCFPSLDPLWFPLPAQPSAAWFHLSLTSPGLSLFSSLPLWNNAILQDGRPAAADAGVSPSAAPANVTLLYEMYRSNPHTRQITQPLLLSEPSLSIWGKVRCVCVWSSNAAAQHLPLVANGTGADALQRLSLLSAASALLSLSSQSVRAHCEVYSWFRTDPALWSCIQSLRFLFRKQMASNLSESLENICCVLVLIQLAQSVTGVSPQRQADARLTRTVNGDHLPLQSIIKLGSRNYTEA